MKGNDKMRKQQIDPTAEQREAKNGFDKTMAAFLDSFRKSAEALLKSVLTTEGILRCLLPADFVFDLQVSESERICYKSNVLEIEPVDPLEGVKSGLVYICEGKTYQWGSLIPRTLAEVGKMGTSPVEAEAEGNRFHRVFQYCTLDELAIVADNMAELMKGIWDSIPERPDRVADCMEDLESLSRRSGLPVPDSLLS